MMVPFNYLTRGPKGSPRYPPMRVVCAAILFLVVATNQLPAALGPLESQRDIGQFIRELGSPQFTERQAAAMALEEIGGSALTALRKAAQGADPEVRWRAAEITQRVGRRMEADRLLKSRRVHVVAQDVPVLDALADFARETGVSIRTVGDQTRIVGKSVNLEINARSFWEGLDQLCHQAGLAEVSLPTGSYRGQTLTPVELAHAQVARRMREEMGIVSDVQGARNDISLMAGDPTDAPTFYAGAVRIRAVPTALTPREARPDLA